MGKVHGSLARAGKVRRQTPKVAKQECRTRRRSLVATPTSVCSTTAVLLAPMLTSGRRGDQTHLRSKADRTHMSSFWM
ncbi:hypothetical protein ACP275_13G022500 [Erythranthe tilingii]